MEANHKRRGFFRGKLVMSFYRAAKPSSIVQFSSKAVKPTPSSASVGFRADHELSMPPPKQKAVSLMVKPDSVRDSNGFINSLYGGGGDDENVDMKAASYISFVQERFRNEQADIDWKKYQEMHS